ncbi:uncharacterized protein HD556DRAFT_1447548 [Suillus plorans]|uniref:Uncharacterized protein n=1 Tax=Suillus plorans TaxID=116603 RepID=A0A9P7DDD3_9AGAM|nr:uncharacterized protein HD556DRAFT_1447548 [Suillus plorans]KAG1788886.1 hypothetical protein HD556DRAFT_1447548 [Suillus plorans]
MPPERVHLQQGYGSDMPFIKIAPLKALGQLKTQRKKRQEYTTHTAPKLRPTVLSAATILLTTKTSPITTTTTTSSIAIATSQIAIATSIGLLRQLLCAPTSVFTP